MVKKMQLYADHITEDPHIMVGKPVVTETRIPVETVVAHLAENPNLDDLFTAFPHLTIEDVQACLAFKDRKLESDREHVCSAQLAGA